MSIGEKGMKIAAKVLARSAIDLLSRNDLLQEIQLEYRERIGKRTYVSPIPSGQKPVAP